jgi:hypothetical protein
MGVILSKSLSQGDGHALQVPADKISAELIGENMLDFYNNWDSYLATTMRFLGEQPLGSFTPSIILLDEMIASILIERYFLRFPGRINPDNQTSIERVT